jgi:hypothetical protein
MKTIDNRASLHELDEIFKYKDLIGNSDKGIIKQIILDVNDQSTEMYSQFLKLVADEVDHSINKREFNTLKDNLIVEMKAYLELN